MAAAWVLKCGFMHALGAASSLQTANHELQTT
jgi:hypothetical protein